MIKEVLKGVGETLSFQRGKDIIEKFSDYWNISKSKQTSWVATGLNTWGNFFTKARFRLYKEIGADKEEIYDHPFLTLLKRPNEFQTAWELKYYLAIYFGIKGNNYWLKVPNKLGKPGKYIMIDPMRVRVVGSRTNYISYYEYNTDAEIIKLTPDQLIHFRFPNPNSLVSGEALISTISEAVDIDKLQMAYMKRFYEQGGFLGGIFSTTATLDSKVYKRSMEMLEKKYGRGVHNAYKVALFEQGLQPIKSAYSIKEMELSAQRKLTMEEISSAFRIPQILLGGASDSYNRATAEAGIYSYMTSFVDPLLSYVDEVLTKEVKSTYNDKLIVIHDALTPKDVEALVKTCREMVQVGSMTVNEMRRELDYEPLPYELCNKPLYNVGGSLIDLSKENVIDMEQTPKSKDYNLEWKQFNRRFENELRIIKNKVNLYFDGQQGRLIEVLNKKDIFKIEDFFTGEGEFLIFVNMVENRLNYIMEQGVRFGGGKMEDSPYLKEQLSYIIKNLTSVNETTKKELLKAIKDTPDIIEAIKEKYSNFKQNRTPLISETIVESGFNAGVHFALKQMGFKEKIWVSQKDNSVRDSHRVADGQIVKIDEPFMVGNSALMYPGDPLGEAKEVINCRCTLIGRNNE